MLELIDGCNVPKAELLEETYEIGEYGFIANVNASKIKRLFEDFIGMQTEHLFFILELPVNEMDEQRLCKNNTSSFHNDVYYIDGLDKETALVLFEKYHELLIHDGLSKFGFGVHDNSAELMAEKYNTITLWTKSVNKYIDFFEKQDIPQVKKCVMAWDTFTTEMPGESWRVEMNGKTVFDLPNELKDWGFYLAEQRED